MPRAAQVPVPVPVFPAMPEPALLACALAFLAGSIPFGWLLTRLIHAGDLRTQGSGNIGATNVTRVLGFWPWGLLTFALDVIKGAAPVLVVEYGGVIPGGAGPGLIWSVGLAAVLGHCYSPWMRLRGGKGVATGFGAIAVLSPWAAVAGIAAFGLAFWGTRTGSVASLCGLLMAAVVHLVTASLIGAHLLAGAAMIWVVLIRHENNLDALLAGHEKTF